MHHVKIRFKNDDQLHQIHHWTGNRRIWHARARDSLGEHIGENTPSLPLDGNILGNKLDWFSSIFDQNKNSLSDFIFREGRGGEKNGFSA